MGFRQLVRNLRTGAVDQLHPVFRGGPKRIQRKRSKGWRMPPFAIYVGRPTIWGNPWTVAETIASGLIAEGMEREVCFREFRLWLTREDYEEARKNFPIYDLLADRRAVILGRLVELRGKDLACWCPLDRLCHADVLLELANAADPDAERGGR